MKKLLRYTWKVLRILLLVFVLLFTAIIIYVSANKKKIIAQVTEDIGRKINGKVDIRDVDLSFFKNFPKVAVRLSDVKITDTMYAAHKHVFFESKEVYITLSVGKLIKKQSAVNGLRVDDAVIYLFTDTSGYSNKYLLKPKSTAASVPKTTTASNPLQAIRLNNVRVVIDDRQKEKLHDLVADKLVVKLNDDDAKTVLDVNADILVNSLAFNLAKGSFLKGKTFKSDMIITYDKKIKQLQFDSIDVKLKGKTFNLTGRFDLTSEAPQFTLKVHTKKADYEAIRNLLPEKISKSLSIVQLDEPLNADAFIAGPLKGGEPLLQVKFATEKATMKTNFMDFTKATFNGYYTNEVVAGLPRKDPNSKIVVNGFSAEWHGIPVRSGNIEILDLQTPTLTADLTADFPLEQLNELIGSSAIVLQSGQGSVQLNYKGPVERNNNTNSFLNGNINFKNGQLLYAPRNVQLKNMNGSLVFRDNDLFIQNIQTSVLGNSVVMNGTAKNLLALMNTEPGKASIDWNIYAPSLNLGAFTFLLKKRNSSAVSSKKSKASLNQAADKIDKVLEQGNLHVNLKAGQLFYKKFSAANVVADISLLQDKYVINKVSMQHAGGNLTMSGAVLTQPNGTSKATINAGMSNVDVKKVFVAFDNFGQDGITSSSLEGSLSTNVVASMLLKDDGSLIPSSIESDIDFSLKNGALINYEPVKKLQNFIFKNRDFENIKFAELKDKLTVRNQDITINRMEIQSSVLSMFVEGIFSNRGKTDISIQVPLNNLKKRKDDYVPENIGTDAKGGRSIFIRGQPGPDGNIKFKLDLFKRYQKDKQS